MSATSALSAGARSLLLLLRNSKGLASLSPQLNQLNQLPPTALTLRFLSGTTSPRDAAAETKRAAGADAAAAPLTSSGAEINHASSSETRPAAPAAPPTPPAATASILPSWLRSLLPGGKDLSRSESAEPAGRGPASASAAAPSPSPSASGTKASAEAQRKDYITHLEKHKDMDMDGFAQLNKQMQMNMQAPRPKVLDIGRQHPDRKKFIDWKRVSYLRTMQHDKIVTIMTPQEKERIKKEGKEVLKDQQLLQDIADRTGVYIDVEVRDCIQGYLDTRKSMRQLYRWTVVLGQAEPMTDEQQRKALKEMQELEDEEDRIEKLEKQDPSNCPILPILDMMGHDARCSRTGLKFYECCGRAHGRPASLVSRDKARALRGLRGRKVPRAERALREGMMERAASMKWDDV